MYPYTAPTGLFFEKLSHEESLDAVLELADYRALCAERDRLRARGVYRGPRPLRVPRPHRARRPDVRHRRRPHLVAGRHHDPARADRQADRASSSITEQGQGTDTILAQVAATTVGVAMEDVRVVTGDTMVTPYGGGTWGSRGAGIGGEATLQTGKALKENILKVAAVVLEVDALALDVRGGQIVDAAHRRVAHAAAPSSGASPTSVPTRCPRTSSRS